MIEELGISLHTLYQLSDRVAEWKSPPLIGQLCNSLNTWARNSLILQFVGRVPLICLDRLEFSQRVNYCGHV